MSGKSTDSIRDSSAPTDDHFVIEAPEPSDGAHLWRIARDCGQLDLNSSYAYLLWCRDFRQTSAVARTGAEVAGFITGYRRPERPDTLLVWQIAVDERWRGRGLAATLLDQLLDRVVRTGVRYLETTVTSDNVVSNRTFDSLARRWGVPCSRTELFAADAFPHHHDPEVLHRIGPFEPAPALS
ncbi:MAG TPA: diaminobutyrate acetyltransferase [Pseudonocardiaceae bacterium]|jgi:diaminobutyrate acetyltransferase|nr:diaminobutyrate acetyltransferase [Pseudonocardiaceae bacterium]